jgi:hypothetical protein
VRNVQLELVGRRLLGLGVNDFAAVPCLGVQIGLGSVEAGIVRMEAGLIADVRY